MIQADTPDPNLLVFDDVLPDAEAYRREAEAFDPVASTAGIERALIALEAARTPP